MFPSLFLRDATELALDMEKGPLEAGRGRELIFPWSLQNELAL